MAVGQAAKRVVCMYPYSGAVVERQTAAVKSGGWAGGKTRCVYPYIATRFAELRLFCYFWIVGRHGSESVEASSSMCLIAATFITILTASREENRSAGQKGSIGVGCMVS